MFKYNEESTEKPSQTRIRGDQSGKGLGKEREATGQPVLDVRCSASLTVSTSCVFIVYRALLEALVVS